MIKQIFFSAVIGCLSFSGISQGTSFQATTQLPIKLAPQPLTPQKLLELKNVSPIGISDDSKYVIYSVSQYNFAADKTTRKTYALPISGGKTIEVEDVTKYIYDSKISANGKYKLTTEQVKLKDVFGTDFYPEMKNSNVQIYDQLNYRHWDTWEDGAYSHVILNSIDGTEKIDLMKGEKFDCPQQPFGGDEDFIWSPDGNSIVYVCKKKYGTEYAISTNTDLYQYTVSTGVTKNLTEGNLGYDTQPAFSKSGMLAWLQMRRDGYESDKNDLIAMIDGAPINLTQKWDGTVNSFFWSNDNRKIYFTAPIGGTVQLFSIDLPGPPNRGSEERFSLGTPKQITNGQFDIRGIVGHTKTAVIVTKGDMNHASEIYQADMESGKLTQMTFENDGAYASIRMSKVEKRIVKTTDGKDMVTWVIYPPDFDPAKKYPTLLYCQGGPQGALSQFYSSRWNFQLMAAQGYIVVAPNRRGMPGYGVEWNEQISKDYGGQNMSDYLSAIDDVSKEAYVDKNRIGCIGASYGGYSAFYLASIHEKRFKTFVAHDGIFNWKSMYGTTEELFFVNWDLGGAYWDKKNPIAQKSYTVFNPAEHVEKWNTPILIIQGGKDFRVPIGQGLEAFQAAQLQGIRSKLLYFPEENHWVLGKQNSLIWHTEFYKWLDDTMPPVDR